MAGSLWTLCVYKISLLMWVLMNVTLQPVASLGGGEGRTAPGDTLQGETPEGKKFVVKFTKNCGQARSDS